MIIQGTHPVRERASALIIVLWVSFGLVMTALYFGQSMSFELRASDNRAASLEADEAILGAIRYATNVLSRVTTPGEIPLATSYRAENVPVGDARFWFIGRDDRQNHGLNYAWGLVDEGSKLNLNVVTLEMLETLPNMTPQLAAAIIDWRDSDETVSDNGAESETYQRMNPPYRAKNTNYESVAELRMVSGMTLDLLYGEDANLNGILDLNENDSVTSLPEDNRDGRLDPGYMEYFTVYSRIPTLGTNINDQTSLKALLTQELGESRANQLRLTPQAAAGQQQGQQATFTSLLEFYYTSGMTRDEMAKVEGYLICPSATNALININTASQEVLACIPGIGTQLAPQIVAYRQSNGNQTPTVAWLGDALSWNAQDNMTNIRQVGPWVCGRAYVFSADIAAVGHHGRGYKRVKYIIDVADGYAQTRYRQDLTYLGWALGRQVRNDLQLLAANSR